MNNDFEVRMNLSQLLLGMIDEAETRNFSNVKFVG